MMSKEKIQAEINAAMASGLYSVAGLNMFDIVEKLEISENLSLHLEYTEEILFEFLSELVELDGKEPGLSEYLKAIKAGDVIDNQLLEKENSFLIGLYHNLSRETAIDNLINLSKANRQLTGNDIFKLHNTLLTGTSSSNTESIRTKNTKFVGRFVNGERVIDYFPIDYKEVIEASNKLAELYNSRLSKETFDNVFFQPFLIHGLVGALQIFNDGNTRMGRVMQHALMWQLINEKTKFNFELPPIYATRSYYPNRGKYREKIANLVKENNNQAWNDWFDFNLNGIEDNIYASRENVKALKRQFK